MNLSRLLHESDSVFILPLGGLAEIGMNFMAIIHKGRAMVIDSGVMFPEPNHLGIDLVLPDVSFFKEYDVTVTGVVFTHAHEDHIGSIAFLYDWLDRPKLYATEYTFGMFDERIHDYSSFKKDNFHKIIVGKKFEVGPFTVNTLRVTHSMADCLGLAIETPVGKIVHTGDFKIDRTPIDGIHFDEAGFKKLGDEGVLLLMQDSTNVESTGWTESETDLNKSLEKILASITTGKVIVTIFSSNIPRIQGLLDVAKRAGRKIAFTGRSVVSNIELGRRLGMLKYDDADIVPTRHVDDLAPNKVLVISTGTQAEPRSAMAKMAYGIHPDIHVEEGDTVIFSSRHIPGNEKKISLLMNQIYRRGARVIDFNEEFVHTSGHARQDELAHVMKLVRPKIFLPVHGEYRMLVKHEALFRSTLPGFKSLVAENGELLELKSDELKHLTRVTSGKVLLDEERNLLEDSVVKARKKLGQNGLCVISMVVRGRDLKLINGPDLELQGIPGDLDLVNLKEEIVDVLREFKKRDESDIEALEEELRLLTRRFFRKSIDIKPVVIPIVYET